MLVFNFHHVEPVNGIRHADRKHITITPEGLRLFIRTLRGIGMEIVSLREVLERPEMLINSDRRVVLTFDDGYVNNHDEAGPILMQERCPATIFALPGRISGTNAWDQGHLPEAERDALMSLEQMRALAENGYVTFGSHGLSHRNLADDTNLGDEDLQAEIFESHRMLSEELGEAYLPVFAYPWGYYSERTLALMQDSPYRYAFTVETASWQADSAIFEIPRYSVYFRDGNPLVLLAKLARHRLLFKASSVIR